MKKICLYLLIIIFSLFSAYCKDNEVFVSGNGIISSFYMQKFNTSVEEFNRFLEETGEKSNYNDNTWIYADTPLYEMISNEQCAVANISFLEVVKYANWLSIMNHLDTAYYIDNNGNVIWNKKSNGYRIPTCKEWEWAAKGGNKSKSYKYPGSNNLDEVAWYKNNSNDTIHIPGLKKANELGIYDMFGNVGEWCWDEYISIPDIIILEGANKTDPKDWETIASTFKADSKHSWIRIAITDFEKLGIDVDNSYVEKYKGRATYYTTFWKDELQFSYSPYPLNESGCSYMGIRLVRNAD